MSWMLVISVKGKQQNVNDESTECLHATYMYKLFAECYTLCDCMQKQVMSGYSHDSQRIACVGYVHMIDHETTVHLKEQ